MVLVDHFVLRISLPHLCLSPQRRLRIFSPLKLRIVRLSVEYFSYVTASTYNKLNSICQEYLDINSHDSFYISFHFRTGMDHFDQRIVFLRMVYGPSSLLPGPPLLPVYFSPLLDVAGSHEFEPS